MNSLNKGIYIQSTSYILLNQWYIRNAFMNELGKMSPRKTLGKNLWSMVHNLVVRRLT